MIIWFPLELVPWLPAPHRLPPRPIFGTMAAFKGFGVFGHGCYDFPHGKIAIAAGHTINPANLPARRPVPSPN